MNYEKNEESTSKHSATIELRSDVKSDIVKPVSGSLLKTIKGPHYIGCIGLVLILILIVVFGVYAAKRNVTKSTEERTDNGIFGQLPFASEQEKVATTSGLSGKTCDHPTRRPIGVMLAGDPINRPISGFSQADMVWELPALVSNVTRLLAVYQCGEPTDIGSVRSARHDYLFLADGVDAIISHWGGSYHALNRINAGEFQSLDALVNPSQAFFRKSNLPAPYNGFTTYANLWRALQDAGYRTEANFKGYEFKDDINPTERPAGGKLSINWPGQFRVHYEYDPQTNRYVRFWAGIKQIDAADKQVVAPSAVVVIRATNEFADGPGGYNDVGIQGSGTGTVFQDGQSINITWSKSTTKFNDPMIFTNAATGQPVIFTRGQVWIMTPSSNIDVTWEPLATTTSP